MTYKTEIIPTGNMTEAEDIIRCLTTLYGTTTGEQILDRDFGIDANIIDLPVNVAAARLAQEIIEKTEKYEPRAEVTEVSPDWDITGTMVVKIYVTLK